MLTAYQFALMIAAPITAAITILGVVVVRGTKITEFRQAWINAQRDDLALIVANTRRLVRAAAGTSSSRLGSPSMRRSYG